MTIETRPEPCTTVQPASLAEHLKAAASAAIEDVLPAIMAEPRKVRVVTIELELANGSQVKAGTCWIERGVNINRLLGFSERREQA